VVCQQVVPVETGTADGRSVIQTGMWTVPVVLMQPARQSEFAELGSLVGLGPGPLAHGGEDKADAQGAEAADFLKSRWSRSPGGGVLVAEEGRRRLQIAQAVEVETAGTHDAA
jgi:hypothetical protein